MVPRYQFQPQPLHALLTFGPVPVEVMEEWEELGGNLVALADDAPQREQVLAVADEQAMYRAALQAARLNSAGNATLAY